MSMEFLSNIGPRISAKVKIKENEIESVMLTPDDTFKVIVSENKELAEKIFLWCKAYCQKKEPLIELPFSCRPLTTFEENVLSELKKIKIGHTVTYKQLAKMCGSPKAFRAVGKGCGKNPWPLFVPCHRVHCSDGSLGGFSQGIELKKQLLDFEGIIL